MNCVSCKSNSRLTSWEDVFVESKQDMMEQVSGSKAPRYCTWLLLVFKSDCLYTVTSLIYQNSWACNFSVLQPKLKAMGSQSIRSCKLTVTGRQHSWLVGHIWWICDAFGLMIIYKECASEK